MTVNSLIKKLEQKVSGAKAAVQISWADSYTIIAGLKELLSLKEQVAALESKEVCNAPHEDVVIEGCPYCRLESLSAEYSKLRDIAEAAYSEMAFACHDLAGRRLTSDALIEIRANKLARCADELRTVLDSGREGS